VKNLDRKLTLSLNKEAIARAKAYAKRHGTSVSKLTEQYFNSLTQPASEAEITPLVRSLSGVMTVPDDYDYKEDLYQTLLAKHV
jgi:hypothetical protein